jgi:flagellar motor switch protein FliG
MAKFYGKEGKSKDGEGGQKRYDIPGPKKAAIALIAMGMEASAEVLKNMTEPEVEQITAQIARLEGVTPEIRESVLEEFHQLIMARQFIAQGGLAYAEEVLEAALGPRKAREILEKVQGSIRTTGFNMLDSVDPNQLINFIQKEHPQTVAVLLGHMNPDRAAAILSELEPGLQVDVTMRIATMDSISPDILHQVEQVLAQQMKTMFSGDSTKIGGPDAVAEILNRVDRGAERNIISNMERDNPALADEIKKRMFVFEDIILIDDRSMQKVLKVVEQKDLPMALKGATEQVQGKFFNNMSSRAAEALREELTLMPPTKLKDIEEIQQKIVAAVRGLEEKGEITISGRGGDSDVVV